MRTKSMPVNNIRFKGLKKKRGGIHKTNILPVCISLFSTVSEGRALHRLGIVEPDGNLFLTGA